MTAMDNLVNDFHWVPSLLVSLARFVGDLGPLLALIGALWVFYLKEASSRAANARRERLDLYVRFLKALDAATNCLFEREIYSEKTHGAVMSVININAEFRLLAPESVSKAAWEMTKAMNLHYAVIAEGNMDFSEVQTLDRSQKARVDEYVKASGEARRELIDAMRSDLGRLSAPIEKDERNK